MLIRETPCSLMARAASWKPCTDVAGARGAVLICHPNPVQGGTMLNKVVSTLQRTARDAGYITLRFNYRGVGQSAGCHDMGPARSPMPRRSRPGCGPSTLSCRWC